jgi:hypothetical protein
VAKKGFCSASFKLTSVPYSASMPEMIVPPGPLPRGSSMAILFFHFGSTTSSHVFGSWSGGTRLVLTAMVKMLMVRGFVWPPGGTSSGMTLSISADRYGSTNPAAISSFWVSVPEMTTSAT